MAVAADLVEVATHLDRLAQNLAHDDTPGIKFWYSSEYERELLINIFKKALEELEKPEARNELA